MEKSATIKIFSAVVIVGVISGYLIYTEFFSEYTTTTLPEDPINQYEDFEKGTLHYYNPLAEASNVSDWEMEGPGEISFADGWMKMESPNEEWHHVYWCPEDFPSSLIAEWYVQLLEIDQGLLIIFFAAQGVNGEDVLDPSLDPRDGTFEDYKNGDIKSYHISYYSDVATDADRTYANLRKNPEFYYVQQGRDGIPHGSTAIHKITLVKNSAQIVMFLDGDEIVNWTDEGEVGGDAYGEGKMGFRQMKWTNARYQNFTVWNLK